MLYSIYRPQGPEAAEDIYPNDLELCIRIMISGSDRSAVKGGELTSA